MSISRTICLGFLALIAMGTCLLMLPISTASGTWNDPIVAFFTSTSAVCVTGLAVVDTGSYFSFWGQLFIVFLIQVGGLGYMTTTTFLILLVGRRFDLRQKFAIQESFDRPFLQGSQNLMRSILATTLVFEITGIIILFQVFAADHEFPRSLWLAIFHSISAWNNAGFSLFSDSLVRYRTSIPLNFIIPTLIIFGGLGYQVIMELYLWILKNMRRQKAKFVFSLNFKVVTSTTLILLVLGTIAFFFTEIHNPEIFGSLSLKDKFIAAWFQSVTTRTAGFNTIDIGKLSTAGLFITIGFMFIGASPSGTGGGTKTTTIRILSSCTRSILQGKEEVIIYQREVPLSLILKAIGVLVGSGVAIVAGTIFLSITDANFDFISLLFEVVSAFATVGLSTGITASISELGKLLLIAMMYMGRVGILLFMSAILGDARPSVVKYPEETLLVG
ncbi:MAG: TrkH family potassium uptake protein [Oscillatoria sp. PMC 1068.18]|nr:TrkH family potassium uptake protein [Oscillatoria sp. PMC 1076.18]MEC4989655.1 TrkH family potassium uptake protein [Oscillatoria sp. PMC 1068.18]